MHTWELEKQIEMEYGRDTKKKVKALEGDQKPFHIGLPHDYWVMAHEEQSQRSKTSSSKRAKLSQRTIQIALKIRMY